MPTVTYIDPDGTKHEVEVAPGKRVMQAAIAAGIDGIAAECGGQAMCATCHVYVTQGLETCPPATDDEEDMLDTARAVTPESRLSCQCVPNGTRDVTVVVPAWNKNLVKEGH